MKGKYKRADKLIRKMKKQKHVRKDLVNMAVSEVTDQMKKSLPKYEVRNGVVICWHDMLA